jgi:exopolysaccharide production protein ExoQ
LGTGGPSVRIWRATGFQWPHAHNAFIEVWLDLGLVGVGLLVLVLLVYALRTVLWVRRIEQPEAVWPLMMLFFLFLFMLTGVPIPSRDTLFMIVFSSCAFTVSAPVLEQAGEPARGAVDTHRERGVGPTLDSTAGADSPA